MGNLHRHTLIIPSEDSRWGQKLLLATQKRISEEQPSPAACLDQALALFASLAQGSPVFVASPHISPAARRSAARGFARLATGRRGALGRGRLLGAVARSVLRPSIEGEPQSKPGQMKCSLGTSQPETGASAFVILDMCSG